MAKRSSDCATCTSSCNQPSPFFYKTEKGLSDSIVRTISNEKNEPAWMLNIRLKAFDSFKSKEMQKWGPDLSELDLDQICFYLKASEKQESSWDKVDKNIKKTFDDLGITKAEKEYLGGVGVQYESEVVYHNLKEEWEKLGVIFVDTDTALKKHPELFKKYFGSVVPLGDNKFSDLNTAVWSGGSFIYVPEGVNVTVPLQAYYRINEKNLGQFERTLIIADEGSTVSYIEGCTAPSHSTSCLHSAVVEIIAKKGARVRYYTIQNWSKNVYNLVTKRAVAHENSIIEWIDGNIGSCITMKYPAVILKGEGAKAEVLSLAVAGSEKQIQDSGAKAIHLASNTSSKIISKSISSNGGRCSFRGKIKVVNGAKGCKSFVQCDALLLDDISRSDTYPYLDVAQKDVDVGHEARVSRIADDQLFYLMSRGLSQENAEGLLVNGFVEPFIKQLPLEYAVEINRLIEMEMKGSVG